MLNVFQPQLGLDELVAAGQVFASNWVGNGRITRQFEAAFSVHLGVEARHCLAITSCTEGLFQAMELLNVGPGDEVIIPSIHFAGAANAVLARGAAPVFCDVDRHSLNAGVEHIAAKLRGRTAAVIGLHYGGAPGEIEKIADLCRQASVALVEDCACSPGSWVDGWGACGTLGDIGVWSFDAMKVISTGDGGLMYVKNPGLLEQARKQVYLGVDRPSGLTGGNDRWWEFEAGYPGRRVQMNDITAAIGLEQLKRLPGFVTRRLLIASHYQSRLSSIGGLTAYGPSYYFFWIQTERRDELARYLRQKDIYTTFRYYPLHRAFKTGDNLPGADWAADRTLLLPLHPALTDFDVDYICDQVGGFFDTR